MPTIQDILHQCGGMTYATALGMIMSYYAMNVKEDMCKYIVIIWPWGKYVYNKMPDEVNISADIFQRKLSMPFQNMPYVLVYIDDILVITKRSYKQHLQEVGKVLEKLQEAGMQLSIEKSHFATVAVDYLGYIISREGIKPQPSKVQLIVDIPQPKTSTQVKQFS